MSFDMPKLPEGWSWQLLEDVCDRISVGHVGETSAFFCDEGGVPLIRSQNVRAGFLDTSDIKFVTTEFHQKSKKSSLRAGDVLIVRVGQNRGDCAVVPEGMGELNCANIVLTSPKGRYSNYLGYYFNTPYGREALLSLSSGSAQLVLNTKAIAKLPVPYPPEETAVSIGEFGRNLDDRIDLLRQTNATLEAIAQALFKSWFVDFDPVHANAAALENKEQTATLPPELQTLFPATFTETPQGSVPEGWAWGMIADFADLNPESWTAKKHPATVAYIDLANAKDNVIADIAEFDFDAAPSRARRVLRDGDTIVGTVRPGNRSFAFIQDAADNLTGSTGFAVLRPKHQSNTAFIYLAATNDNSIDHLTHVADGGAYPAVRPEVVANLSCICPPTEVLEAFNAVAAELLIKIAKNHQQAQTLATLRDTLLPRLISGTLRLPEAAL